MQELQALVEELRSRGIAASLDPRDLDAPGALVELERVGSDAMLCGDYTATATVYLLAPDNGRGAATATLLDMYDRVADMAHGAETVDIALPETGTLPALRLSSISIGDI
mgnify:CR=1 FL=1